MLFCHNVNIHARLCMLSCITVKAVQHFEKGITVMTVAIILLIITGLKEDSFKSNHKRIVNAWTRERG